MKTLMIVIVGIVEYKNILRFGAQNQLFDEDFDDCDSGYCGI